MSSFELRPPHPKLSAMILCYWRLEGLVPGRLYAAAPKRHVEFVVNIGAPQLAGAEKVADTAFDSCWMTGLRETPLYLRPTGASILYGVRFRDFAAPEWLSGDLSRNRRWSTDLASAGPARRLAHAVARCSDLATAARSFDAFFLSRREPCEAADPLARAVRRCEEQSELSPAAIAQCFEGPERRARVQAQGRSGLTLRRFARLARFDRALHALGGMGGARIADIAVEAGYYDEAHMAHDFSDFCGVTPAAYRRARQRTGERLPHHLFAWD